MKIIWIVLAVIAAIMILVTIVANNKYSAEEERGEKKKDRKGENPKPKKNYLWPIIAIILLGLLIWQGFAGKKTTPVQQTMEFYLVVGEETPTVEAGPGTRHRIWANKPYKMRRVLPNGGEKFYQMPSGWETLTGVEPIGRVRLIGEKKNTVVKIVKIK